MIIQSERISLKHLLSVEALSDQEVMGLIHRGQEFKRGAQWNLKKSVFCDEFIFSKIVQERIKALK